MPCPLGGCSKVGWCKSQTPPPGGGTAWHPVGISPGPVHPAIMYAGHHLIYKMALEPHKMDANRLRPETSPGRDFVRCFA